jgi:predicted Zn-dependent peptidase
VYAPVQTDRTADAVAELLEELRQFLGAKPATRDERDRVVRNSAFSLPGQYETNGAVLSALLANDRFGRPDDFVSTLAEQYRATTLDSVQAAAQAVLQPGRLTWVIVGDRAGILEDLQRLDIAPVELMDADGKLLSAE